MEYVTYQKQTVVPVTQQYIVSLCRECQFQGVTLKSKHIERNQVTDINDL